ncbi:MBL fold metallo-hydrolase [Marinicella gelatinilytica]|uniref:MBL fold metallo-hydrolase n=1 Tax=Marinicella gelatinilytica TaxID=2996017 RepID=UPI002260A8BA|nr:MBL fold metallo-hydrolase [Marinicella gelatinilytica]MCX7544881.1 MBL fold metallo-hydrolase [Marinicella gelatinilytica]
MKTFKLAVFVFVLTGGLALAQEPESEPVIDFKTTEVAKGIYMLSGENGFTGGNLGLLVGDEAVILIDDSMPQFLDKMQDSIKAVTERPINYVLNTHLHGDHTGNNAAVSDAGAHIIAHDNVRKRLIKKGIKTEDVMQPAPKNTLPVITFQEAIHLYFNEQPMRVFHVPHAHTDGDAVIYFSDANVIHAGDVFFNGRFPYIDLSSGGSLDGMIAALKKIDSMADNNTQIIPGHGDLADKKDLKAVIDMLEDSRDKIQVLLDQGLDETAIVAENPLVDYHNDWNWGFITTEKMVKQLVQSLSQDTPHSH